MRTKDEAEIKRLCRRADAAVSAGDLDGWVSTLTNGVVFLPHGSPKVTGKKAVAAWAKSTFFDPFKIKLRSSYPGFTVFGSLAFGTGSWRLELTPKSGGDTRRTTGKKMVVFRKQADGSWKLAQEIFNGDKR